MVEISDHDAQYASQIIERLLSSDGERQELELEEDVVIFDLERDVVSFSIDLDITTSFTNGRMPAVRLAEDDGYVPVSLQIILGSAWPFYPSMLYQSIRPRRWWMENPFFYEYLHYILRLFRDNDQIDGFHIISQSEAREAFTRRATNFLATRVAAVRRFREGKVGERDEWGRPASLKLLQSAGGKQVITPGCYFSVSTNTIGLRVFWSGAHLISPNYFSHPTTPAKSVLQAGKYIFGVDGGAYGGIIQWDTNAVVTLPGNPSVHLNY